MNSIDRPGADLLDRISASLVEVAEIGGNRLLGYDEIALASCAELQGSCIAVEITDLEFRLYCHPGSWGIRLSQQPPAREVDATISGRLMALVNLAAQEDKLSTSIQEQVTFQGNVGLAQKLQKIIADLDIDWEQALSERVGDLLAFQIASGARSISEWLRRSTDSVLSTTSEYIREEARLSPTDIEFDEFQQRVADLKNDVARAEQRLERLFDRLRPQ